MSGISGIKQNSYGSIQHIGTAKNGRELYCVINSEGEESGQLTVPKAQKDTFEKAYNDILETAPKIQKYAKEHSSPTDIQKRKNYTRAVTVAGGVLGAAIPLFFARKASSVVQILSMVVGIFVGLGAGFVTGFVNSLPPGTLKFEKASIILSRLDIQRQDKEENMFK